MEHLRDQFQFCGYGELSYGKSICTLIYSSLWGFITKRSGYIDARLNLWPTVCMSVLGETTRIRVMSWQYAKDWFMAGRSTLLIRTEIKRHFQFMRQFKVFKCSPGSPETLCFSYVLSAFLSPFVKRNLHKCPIVCLKHIIHLYIDWSALSLSMSDTFPSFRCAGKQMLTCSWHDKYFGSVNICCQSAWRRQLDWNQLTSNVTDTTQSHCAKKYDSVRNITKSSRCVTWRENCFPSKIHLFFWATFIKSVERPTITCSRWQHWHVDV